MTTNNTNASGGFQKSVLRILNAIEEVKSGPLELIAQFPDDLSKLLHNIKSAAGNREISTSSIIREHFAATPDGEKLLAQRADFAAIKSKSFDQKLKFKTLTDRVRAMEAHVSRSVAAYEGFTILRALLNDDEPAYTVTIANVPGTSRKVCKLSTPGNMVDLTIAHLQKVGEIRHLLTGAQAVEDVKDILSGGKKGAANTTNNANGERIDPSKLGNAIASIDTSIAAVTSEKTGRPAIGGNAKAQMLLLWARLDSVLTDAEKEKAKAEYTKEAAPTQSEADAA